MNYWTYFKTIALSILLTNCFGQTINSNQQSSNIVGAGCDGCELMYIGLPKNILSIDTSSAWFEKGQKLVITGTVFNLDGKSKAKGIIIYYWQADDNGFYSPGTNMDRRALRHGHIRGWVKTDENGKYTIHTIRPAAYPNELLPAHIHLAIKEPGIKNEYYTDEINFDDDKLLKAHFKKYPPENRGGTAVVKIIRKENVQIATHNIVLGLNIPNYPKK